MAFGLQLSKGAIKLLPQEGLVAPQFLEQFLAVGVARCRVVSRVVFPVASFMPPMIAYPEVRAAYPFQMSRGICASLTLCAHEKGPLNGSGGLLGNIVALRRFYGLW